MASAALNDEASVETKKPLTFLDLPPETQKDIIGHCAQFDLICVSLVSRHFRDLAAAQLYRNFHIVFPDDDDPTFDSPIDGLAGGLDTFVTSEYDYARHLKDLSLDTLSAGDKAENAYKPYLYSASCGKFMNTLLLLTLRKATALESFKWNIRVELSRPVYKALHRIDSLTNLHVRMQAGPSLYETPPPLPYTTNTTNSTPSAASSQWEMTTLPPASTSFSAPLSQGTLAYTPGPPPLPPVAKAPIKSKVHRKSSQLKEPPTLSGFKKLKTLAVLDVDTLDVAAELKKCVQNSQSTLTKLKLSFSDSLANQSRKPPPDADPEDSDADDEFQVVPMSQNTSSGFMEDASGPAKAFRAQEERKSQESFLGRIFDVEQFPAKHPQQRRSTKSKENETKSEPSGSPGEDFVNAIKTVSTKLLTKAHGSADSSPAHLELLDLLENAARTYVESEHAKKDAKKEKAADTAIECEAGDGGSNAEEVAATSGISAIEKKEASMPSLFGPEPAKLKELMKESTPEDIDIEQPVDLEELDDQIGLEKEAPKKELASNDDASTSSIDSMRMMPSGSIATPTAGGNAIATAEAEKVHYESLLAKLAHLKEHHIRLSKEIQSIRTDNDSSDSSRLTRLAEAETRFESLHRAIKDIENEIHTSKTAALDEIDKQLQLLGSTEEVRSRRISEYVRSTRGLALESLSIHLIPVKASVLFRALDLRALKRLTLLNVGAQAPVWTLLAKENSVQPLALRKIFTDNVSPAFLTCVSQLQELHEMFVLERSAKHKPESFAPKTMVTADQIRRTILKKHMHTLRKLMIKNESGPTWDADEKIMLLICCRGAKLEELAVSMNIRAVHAFMQNLSGLAKLRALNIIHFRNDDTCVWVMRETRKFIVDNLSHFPNLKLEWISIDDDRVERIIRASDLPPKSDAEKKKKDKGKAKAATTPPPNLLTSTPAAEPLPLLPVHGWDSESDSDDEDTDLGSQNKLETIENVNFYDVWGVRIFKKEIMTGRL